MNFCKEKGEKGVRLQNSELDHKIRDSGGHDRCGSAFQVVLNSFARTGTIIRDCHPGMFTKNLVSLR